MQNLEKQVGQRLTRFYIIALSAVAILSLAGQMLIQNSLKESLNDAHVVNVAGRQRMLSQRLCKTIILLTNPMIQGNQNAVYQSDLRSILPLWKTCHEGLRDGFLIDSSLNYSVKNSAKIKELFEQLDPVFQKIYTNAIKVKNDSLPNQNKEITQEILNHERNFLLTMDKIVRQYDLEATERVNRVKSIELTLFGLTILVLLAEAILIFLPLTKYIKTVIKKIIDSEKELQTKNSELSISNQKLTQAQADLLKTTEEKYELIRKEDLVRTASLLEGQEQERERIAKELHDGIGQMLTGLKLHSEKLKNLPFINEKQRKDFVYHQNLINETIQATRHVSFNLMPVVLSDFGLVAVLKLLVEQTHKSADIEVNIEENLKNKRLPYNYEINLYRIAQEAINNAIKHSKTKKIDIKLSKANDSVKLIIEDFGVGFDLKKVQKEPFGNGLKNISERIRLLNGSVNIESKPDKGTAITVRLFIV
jgi:signal transduction histidine kinase